MSKIPVEYSTNNSGGNYWLTKEDWRALQDAGWLIMDWDNSVYDEKGQYVPDENGLPMVSHPADLDKAHYAFKLFDNIQEALVEFEKLTGQNVSDEGCNCCGAPHSFTWGKDIIVRVPIAEQDYNLASGEDLLEYMYPNKPANLSKRELLERLS